MVANEGPARGSAAATASLRRRRMGPSGGGAANGGANTMLQFYTEKSFDSESKDLLKMDIMNTNTKHLVLSLKGTDLR
ncbi:hypothetical protein ZOSMA_72G00390 [Zostera marina]|uniref:Uncharacterized protein n=1 Tax=Zostera marina TaxID=29655 RepID=A0A0K9NS26_ZOSMR|nr:hypothetical protein ZOSMA_72G00390 [Zostera marina]